jgi:uncharacterized protein
MLRVLATIGLLVGSNIFMTFAWYYHLKMKEHWPLLMAIGISWLIALPEYCLQVPANRIGHGLLTLPQLKVLQEAITLSVFTVFAIVVMHERPRANDVVAFVLIIAAVAVSFYGRAPSGG